MNNLKRVLSLGLTGAMLAGLLTMGASAADFTDADKIQYDEAVNVLVALKVIDGKPDGSFDPEGNVTRAEMAKMIAVAMNGGTDANTGTKTTPSFTDIGGHWAESYIEYCADLGIISGRGDGTFDPGANVTGLEAAKMVLSALGFESTAYKLTGATWAVRTDEVARTQTGLKRNPTTGAAWDDPKLYEELENIVLATPATREVAAQLIWNALQNHTRIVAPDRNTNSGEVTWSYQVGSQTLLKERYDANVAKGVFNGNYYTGHAANKGEVDVNGWDFPYDIDIDEIGEEFKVVWRDNKDGKTGPDKRDIIYGAFNTHKTEVYRLTMNELQDAKNKATDKVQKIKFGDTKYDAADYIEVLNNYSADNEAVDHDVNDFSNSDIYRIQSVDKIKFVVLDNADSSDDGKIYKAYITNYYIGRVTSANSSKLTIQGVGSIDIADNDVYDSPAVDDVVVYTQFYHDNKDDAFFTVTKAETVEGKMTGFKKDGTYKNVVLDGETIKVNRPATSFKPNLTKEYVTELNDTVASRTGYNAAIGDTIRIYKMDNMVGCIQLVDSDGGKYAVVTEISDGEIGSTMNPLRVSVVMADGSEQVLLVHKDSTYDGAKKIKDDYPDAAQLFTMAKGGKDNTSYGNLVEYSSIANGSIKLKRVASAVSDDTIAGAVAMADNTSTASQDLIWDKDARTLKIKDTTDSKDRVVAAAEAVMFVGVDNDVNTSGVLTPDNEVEDWYTYDMRAMGDINAHYQNNSKAAGVTVQYFLNDKGLADAAAIVRNARPGSNTSATLYGIITGYTGTRQNTAGDDLWIYTVAVGRAEDVTVAVDTQGDALSAGMLVMFDEAADGEYDLGTDIVVIVGGENGRGGKNDDVVATTGKGNAMAEKTEFILAAVREYNAEKGVISYYADTSRATSADIFEGAPASKSVDKDVALFYVNANDNKQGDDGGVTIYNTDTGYANAILHLNDKGVVDAIIVETSGKANLADANVKDTPEWTAKFGKITENTISATGSLSSNKGAAYGAAYVSYDGKEVGNTFTVYVSCTGAPTAAETIEVTYNGTTKTMTFTGTGTKGVSFTIGVDGNGDPVTSASVSVQA